MLTLACCRNTDYKLALCTDPSPSERYAADEFIRLFYEVCGVRLPIVGEDETEPDDRLIVVGGGHLTGRAGLSGKIAETGDDGYVLRTSGNNLYIAGGKLRGTLYGVYSFFEDSLGCRFFTKDLTVIPKRAAVEIGDLDVFFKPVFEYREVYYTGAFDGDFAARSKCNGNRAALEPRHGGGIRYGHFGHSMETYLPPEVYFNEHPDYFAEVDGVRVGSATQPCLSHPDVLRIITEKTLETIRKRPDAKIFSVSQTDHMTPCRCAACMRVYEEEQSHSGILLRFVNAVAEAVEKEFPDVLIDTFAYQHTRTPPRVTRPRRNVIVRLCSIERCFAHPHGKCDENEVRRAEGKPVFHTTTFADDLRGWAKIAPRLYAWDYTTNFAFYVIPHPNLRVLQKNVQFFAENNVRGLFAQGNAAPGAGGEFAELKTYLLSKLLWDPRCDYNRHMDEFLAAYYGCAGPAIRRYIDFLHDHTAQNNIHIGIVTNWKSPMYTPAFFAEADRLFDYAERVAEDGEKLLRVQTARMPVRYAKIRGMEKSAEKSRLLDDFYADCLRMDIRWLAEGDWPTKKVVDLMRNE